MKGRRIFKISLLTISLTIAITGWSQAISPYLFGVNAWMPDTIGDVNNCFSPPCIRYGKLHKNWKNIADSKATNVRYGGISTDKNIPTKYQYLRMVDSIRARGMEPILQVPFYNYQYTAQDAAGIVQYINITKGRNVKYWIIANEPNLGYGYTTAAQIATYFRQFASAMKAVDSTIKIVGPETAGFKQTITNGLTTPGGPDDITGKDSNGHYYLDVFTFHTYPFGNGTQSTRAGLISELMAPGNFYDDLTYLRSRLATCNSAHGRTANPLTIGVTEASVNYTNSASDDLYGCGTYSFLGAQFVAEMYGVGMKCGVNFINLWSVIEGNSVMENCGYIDTYTGKKRPLYYHYQLMAENMKGNNVNCTLNQLNVKSFASEDAQQISVIIMNEDAFASHPYTVRLNNATILGSSSLKINVNSGVQAQYSDVIKDQATVVLVFNKSGTLLQKCEYSLTDHAVAGLPPVCTSYMTTSIANTTAGSGLDVHLFPNPTTGDFILELTNTEVKGSGFTLEVFNTVGQVVRSEKVFFENGKEKVELTGLAPGTYIVRIHDGDRCVTKPVILQ